MAQSALLVVGVRGCGTPRLYLSRHADAFLPEKTRGTDRTARATSSRRMEMDDREKPGRFSQRYHRETGFIPLFPSASFLLFFFFPSSSSSSSSLSFLRLFPFSSRSSEANGLPLEARKAKKKKKTRGSAAEPRFTMRIEFHNRATRGTMRQNCVTTRVRIYYIAGPRGGGFRTGGTCVSSVVAAKGIITLRRTRCYTQRLTEEKGSGGGRKRLPTTAKGIDNGPVISGRRRLSRHALNSGKRTAGEPFRFRKRCVILSVA